MKIPGLQYDSPNQFTLKQRAQLTMLSPVIAGVLRALFVSNRLAYDPPGGDRLGTEKLPRAIVGAWHETCGVVAACYGHKHVHTLTSYSFDGEMAARVTRHLGFESIRGSSSRGGFDALVQLEKALKEVPYVGLTLDGPLGPRRKSKPGAALLSARTGVPILPNALIATPCWRLKSWDRFVIPKPFGRIICAYGELIPPPRDTSREAIAETCAQIDASLNALHEKHGDPA